MEFKKLKILHVIPFHPSPSSFIFAKRQVEDLVELGLENHVFYFNTSMSVSGFFKQLKEFKKVVTDFHPDIIHAHYGSITAFFASSVKNIPFVVSFQGSDINFTNDVHWIREKLGKQLSKIAAQRARHIICVSERIQSNLKTGKEKSTIIPSGINTRIFKKLDRNECKRHLNLSLNTHYLFFNSNNPVVKRLDIAQEVQNLLAGYSVQLLSLNGSVEPNEIPIYLNACVATILCSDSEGSPMVIKEAMACGLPIVSVDVGDVKERIDGVNNCFIVAQSADAIASKVKYLIENAISETNGLEILKLQGLDNRSIVRKVEEIYNDAIIEK